MSAPLRPSYESELEARIAELEAERDQALMIERLALAQVKETTALLETSMDRNRTAVLAEREACAMIAASMAHYHDTAIVSPEDGGNPYDAEEHRAKAVILSEIAATIRARPTP